MIADFRRRFWISAVLTLPILGLSPTIQHWLGLPEAVAFRGSDHVLFALSSVVFFYGGWPFLAGSARELAKRQPGMMTLIALAISVAYFYSSAVVFGLSGEPFFWELATLIDVMLLGHWIEMRSVLGASRALESLVRLLPATAHRLTRSGEIEEVPVTALKPGDRVLVKPGEKVPIDGAIVQGRSSFNEAMLTGESRPVERSEGQEAIGGAVNGEGAVVIEVRKTGDQTYLAQVIELVRRAQETRSRTQDLANRAAQWLTWIALAAGGVTFAVWLGLGESFQFALARMVTVMVIACPHALGLAVPLVVAVSTSLTARSGLLIRDRAAFERARHLNAVVFDKTGTLTEGRFGVSEVIPFGAHTPDEVLTWAASLESRSEHPIAAGIVRAAADQGLRLAPVEQFKNLTGQGAEAVVEGRNVKVVSPGYLRARGLSIDRPELAAWAAQGKTVVYLLLDDEPAGAIALADIVRKESFEAVSRLKAMGIQCMMLTGDAQAVARTVATELGLDDYFAEVLPHEKAQKVREIKAKGLTVAMVGDGVNDAPALAASDLGIAIGAGTDVAIESADVVLVRSDPRDVAAILALSRATYHKMVQNLLWATGYNAFAIPLAAGVAYAWGLLLTPALGAALMSVSTVIVAINAKLLEQARSLVARGA
ncbi:heavy metal translocating P-type ATPase [Pelomicrobium methylotrophicum]|uniref:Heavy metal translocating P-type ATPase n=2 Tax=Pelomicrobium methylotrophicum TaxID=2602750 RepID=A0A5C7EUA7_9PROT|nr:heavy metal translocating P-type ATPase [Pelomicrobium methylotrophicum]TXF12304.1 heavy metal translocating P-type ATPase [Pelomicrobium methylotrophicum]